MAVEHSYQIAYLRVGVGWGGWGEALPKTHGGALHRHSISGLIESVIDIVPYLYQLCLLCSLFL